MLDIALICQDLPAQRTTLDVAMSEYQKLFGTYISKDGSLFFGSSSKEGQRMHSLDDSIIPAHVQHKYWSRMGDPFSDVEMPLMTSIKKLGKDAAEREKFQNMDHGPGSIFNPPEGAYEALDEVISDHYEAAKKKAGESLELAGDCDWDKFDRLRESGYINMIMPSGEVDYLMNNNWLQGGFHLANAVTLAEEIMVESINASENSLPMLVVAHIYNAVKQLGSGHIEWSAMDQLIEIHPKSLFAGSVPKSPKAIFYTYGYRTSLGTGISKLKGAQLRRPSAKIPTTKVTQAIQEFMTKNEKLDRTLYQLCTQALEASEPEFLNGNAVGDKGHIEMMEILETYLQATLPKMKLDYTGIIRLSPAILSRISTRAKSLFFDLHGQSRDAAFLREERTNPKKEQREIRALVIIFYALKDTVALTEGEEKRSKKEGKPVMSSLLEAVGKAVSEVLVNMREMKKL